MLVHACDHFLFGKFFSDFKCACRIHVGSHNRDAFPLRGMMLEFKSSLQGHLLSRREVRQLGANKHIFKIKLRLLYQARSSGLIRGCIQEIFVYSREIPALLYGAHLWSCDYFRKHLHVIIILNIFIECTLNIFLDTIFAVVSIEPNKRWYIKFNLDSLTIYFHF